MHTMGWLNGIDRLLQHDGRELGRGRVGLVAHPASVDATGCPTAVRLHEMLGDRLAALFSPEHGFFGIAGAGEKVSDVRHPEWDIPVYSLYGATRRPTAMMLRELDTVVYDLQDLSIRCYTYISTLRYLLEAAAQRGTRVVVLDRPNPLAGIMDGPLLDPAHESFVGCFPGPLVYGLTSGEAAHWVKRDLDLDVDLVVIPATGWRPGALPAPLQWIAPSPSIRHVHTALCYPVTVGLEALPLIDHGRRTTMPFELMGLTGIDSRELADRLTGQRLPGIAFFPVVYEQGGRLLHGVRMAVGDPAVYRPVATAVAVLAVLQDVVGRRLWTARGSRPAFFDKLMGTDSVRCALQDGASWNAIAASWPLAAWKKSIRSIRLHRT